MLRKNYKFINANMFEIQWITIFYKKLTHNLHISLKTKKARLEKKWELKYDFRNMHDAVKK